MIKSITNKILIIICICLGSSALFSQVNSNDFASWNSVGVDYKYNDKIKIGLEQHIRLKEDASVVDEYFTEVFLGYEIFKNFEITGGARLIGENDTKGRKQGYKLNFRFNFDASYKHKISSITLDYRFRYQNKNEIGYSKADGDIPSETVRFKTSVKYNIKKWPLDPKFSAEIFSRLESQTDLKLSKYRLTLGTDYDFKGFGELGVYYRYENIIPVSDPQSISIVGLKYTISIK